MAGTSSPFRRLALIAVACLIGTALPLAQQPPASDGSRTKTRVDDRLRALRQEADRLASQSKTLLGEVRKLEVQRDIRLAESQEAERALTASKEELNDATRRLELLDEQRLNGLPDLKQQLVETYKRGRSGYLRLLMSAGDLRGFARATRAMTALTFRQERSPQRLPRDRRRAAQRARPCCRPRWRS
jgi:septal ring factor EnvC (AmiA/AmiB activator)